MSEESKDRGELFPGVPYRNPAYDGPMGIFEGCEDEISKGTSAPWIAEPGPDEDIWILSDDDDVNDGSIIASVQGPDMEKNAALIVRCVNSHDELVNALDKISNSRNADAYELIAIADKALKQAKGE